MSEAYSIYEAKTHFSKLVKKVREGKEIIIKDRGTPVGKLVPIKHEKSFNQRMEGLMTRGLIASPKSSKIPKGIKKAGALKRFLEDRE